MRKRKKNRKFSRKRDQRKALLKVLLRELFFKEKITTTLAKAKEVARLAEKEITIAKKENIQARRLLARKFSPPLLKKIMNEIVPRYKERTGGYTRVIKLGQRKSDGAQMALLTLIK